jgi:transcriptional regulator with XRE-family HTH domain
MNQTNEISQCHEDPIEPTTGQEPLQKAVPPAMAEKRALLPFGAIIRQLRVKKGLTQKELATKTGYSTPEWTCMLESGTRQINPEDVPQIARILTVNAHDLAVRAVRDCFPKLAAVLFSDVDTKRNELAGAQDKSKPRRASSIEHRDQQKLVEEIVSSLTVVASPCAPVDRSRPRKKHDRGLPMSVAAVLE